ncbi:MAG: co-chaperone GroES [Vulcanimicrobiota bacterium]
MATATVKLTPIGDRVIIKPMPSEEKTKGGVILPDTAKEKPQKGEIIAVGKGKVTDDGKEIKMEVKTGDKVLYGKYAGTEIKYEGEEYLIVKQSEILAIVG